MIFALKVFAFHTGPLKITLMIWGITFGAIGIIIVGMYLLKLGSDKVRRRHD